MEIIRTVREMQTWADEARAEGKSIGFVPTMGYLHEGHMSLVRRARGEADLVVVSVFVNPAQFGPGEDLTAYPRDFDSDRFLLEKEKVDVIFYPEVGEMYPEPSLTHVYVHRLTGHLCGKTRPGHFDGVSLVVAKLFNIVKPHAAYFGQKDWQQLAVIGRMVRDLDFDIRIVACHIVREADGLAMSSRNTYLTPDERKRALVLNRALAEADKMVTDGQRDASVILKRMFDMIAAANPDRIDYVAAVDPETLEEVKKIKGTVLFALAVKFGRARLIDNRLIPVPATPSSSSFDVPLKRTSHPSSPPSSSRPSSKSS